MKPEVLSGRAGRNASWNETFAMTPGMAGGVAHRFPLPDDAAVFGSETDGDETILRVRDGENNAPEACCVLQPRQREFVGGFLTPTRPPPTYLPKISAGCTGRDRLP